jgi:tetratricopeptide (TPR) repeat protein
MDQNSFLLFSKDFIENFDDKNIDVCFLTAIGRSGSLLIQSLFDSHEQILMIPTIIPMYQTWNSFYIQNNNHEKALEKFFNSTILKFDWFEDRLGYNKDDKIDFKLEELTTLTLNIFNSVSYSRKNFILSLHLAYGKIFNVDFSKIKVIFLHEHYLDGFNINQVSEKFSLSDYSNYIFKNNSNLIQNVKEDFLNFKFIFSIRNPYDSFFSFMNLVNNESDIIKPDRFWTHIKYLLISYRDLKELIFEKKLLKDNEYVLIDFQQLHSDTFNIMKKTSDFLDIDYSESILESTIQGKIWWGNAPQKLSLGTIKERNFIEWKTKLSKDYINLLSFSFKTINSYFGYESEFLSSNNVDFEKLYFWSDSEIKGFILNLILYLNTNSVSELYDFKSSIWIEIYPLLRKKLFSFLNPQENISSFNNDIKINGVDICIQYKFNKDAIVSNGYLVCLQSWPYTSITLDHLEYLNKVVDQVWVMSETIKNNYIDSGVIKDKIKVLNYPIDVENTNIRLPALDSFLLEKSFKFLFQGDLNDLDSLEFIIDVLNNSFVNESNISLVLLNSEYLDPYMKKSYVFNQSLLSKINKLLLNLNSNINVKVYLDYKNIAYLDKLYSACDCFIYPYSKESSGIPILRALKNELPVIAPNIGIALEIFQDKNPFLVESYFEDSYISNINSIELITNHKRIVTDKKLFENRLKNVFFNIFEAKKKSKDLKKELLSKYKMNNLMMNIESFVSELKDKPILRFDIDNIIKNLNAESLLYFNLQNYEKSKELYEKLVKLDHKNIDYLNNLAICYLKLKEYDNSLNYFLKVLEISVPDFEILNNIAENLYHLEDYENADFYKNKSLEYK